MLDRCGRVGTTLAFEGADGGPGEPAEYREESTEQCEGTCVVAGAGVEVVVVAYGTPELLDQALGALNCAFPVHVVDNGLSDEAERIAARHGADYVRPVRNVGFAAAVNVGLRRCPLGSDVLLLNPDAQVTPEAVLMLQRGLGSAGGRVAAAAPRLLRPTGEVEQTAWPMPSPTLPWRGAVGRGGVRPGDEVFLSGAVLLLASAAISEVGLFDERFFLYGEESDWERRALLAGWTVLELGEVEAVHVGAATSEDPGLRLRLFHGSAEIFIRKWYGGRGWALCRTGALLASARRLLTARDPGARQQARRTFWLYVRGPVASLPRFAKAAV